MSADIHRTYSLKLDYDGRRNQWAATLYRRTEAGGYARAASVPADFTGGVGDLLTYLGEELVVHQNDHAGQLP